MSKDIQPIFSSRSLMVSGFTFRSLIHFESFCVYGVRKCSIIRRLHAAVLFSQTTHWRDCLLQCIYSYLLCHRLTILYCSSGSHGKNWSLVCAFLYGSLFCSIDLCICFFFWCWYHGVLITVTSLYSLKSGSMIPPTFFFSLKFALAVQGFLRFYKEATLGPSHLCPSQRSSPLGLCSPPPSVELRCRAGRAGVDAQLRLSWVPGWVQETC